MFRKLLHILLLPLIFAAGLVIADENPEAELAVRQLWLDGFLKMSRAAQLAEQGKTSTAIQGYTDAMKLFTEVHDRFPEWNTVMVTYHISFCRLRLKELETSILPNLRNLTVEELRRRLKTEISRNAALAAELDEARIDLQKPADDSRLRERETLISALRQKISELEIKLKLEQLKTSKMKTDEDLAPLQRELAELAIAKEDNEAKINALTKELEEASKQIESLKKQLEEADKWAKEASSTDAAIKAENEQLKLVIMDLNKKLTVFREDVALYLKNRQDIDRLAQMAFELENKEDAASAARYWHTIANKFPDLQEPSLRAAYWYWSIDDYDKSNLLLENYFTATGRNIEPMILLGRVSLDQNNWQRALALTAWAAAAAPGNADAQFSLGTVFLSTAQTTLAKACFRKAITLNPKHVDSLMALAIIYATVEPRNLTEAKNFYEKAVAAGHPLDAAFEAVVK